MAPSVAAGRKIHLHNLLEGYEPSGDALAAVRDQHYDDRAEEHVTEENVDRPFVLRWEGATRGTMRVARCGRSI